MRSYPIPLTLTRTEIRVKNSRFIATLAPVFTVPDAKAFIKQIKTEFSDASHNVPCYLIGFEPSQTAHCNDDGEPSGTAGRPALAVLQGSGLGDVAVVVTRYFGGTKLGTGGLVRAYSDAVKAVLADTPRAIKTPTHTVMFALPYTYFERIKLLAAAHNAEILDEEFAADITLTLRFKTTDFEPFQAELVEMTHGEISAHIIKINPNTIFPTDQS